jgi:hypothetical protein
METAKIVGEMASLPPDAQKQVIDFVAFLRASYSSASTTKKGKQTKLVNEPFIGMWRTRKDLQDSTAWVRSLRQHEWEHGA